MSEQLIRQYVDLLYPPDWKLPDEARFSLWEMPGKRSYHYHPRDPQLEAAARQLDLAGHNVFCGVGLRRGDLGPYQRGSKPDIYAISSLWADIDILGGDHATDNLPSNMLDVVQHILLPFEWEPSMVVNTGGGVHVYWNFDKLHVITDENRAETEEMCRCFQERLAMLAKARGWKWDMTADLPRVLRPTGTHNRKRAPQPVAFMGTPGGTRYSVAMIQAALKTKAGPVAAVIGREPTPVQPGPAVVRTVDPRSEEQILAELKTKLKKNRKKDRADVVKAILAGEPFAVPGERDKVLQQVASWFAWYDQVADPEVLAEFLRPSLEKMAALHPDGAMTIEDAEEKISRAQADARRKSALNQERDERIVKALQQQARAYANPAPKKEAQLTELPGGAAGPPAPSAGGARPALSLVERLSAEVSANPPAPKSEGRYDFEEIRTFIARQEELSGRKLTEAEWKKRWVVMYHDALYIFCAGRYLEPIPRQNFRVSAQRDLSVLLPEWDEEGRYYFNPQTLKSDEALRNKSADEILDEISTVARRVTADLTLPESYYDGKTHTFYEAVTPLRRDLEPRFDQHIQTWLERLGGESSEDVDKLLDWIATITFLEAPSCALFLTGPKGTGKSMLASGLARLWHSGGYTSMENIIGAFNADMARCPLVVADEALPDGPNGKPISTRKLRDLISSDSRQLKRKYMPNTDLKGTIRVMFLANSERFLDLGDETLGPDSLGAVASRILHIPTTDQPRDFLDSLGGRPKGTRDWVNGDLIARHALWLRDERKVEAAGRFWVEGHESRVHGMLATASQVNSQVVEWVIRYLMRPKPEVRASGGVIAGNDELWVNTGAVHEFWQDYIKNRMTVPALTRINLALQGLSKTKDTVRKKAGPEQGQKRYYPLRVNTILEWSAQNGLGDPEILRQVIERKMDEVPL